MRVTRKIVLVMVVFITVSLTIRISPQQNFLIGLNMVIEFTDGGIARIILKQHPFDVNGASLLSDEDVVKEIVDDEESIVQLILLFFTPNPSKAKYEVVSHISLDDNEEVFSNTGKPGVMDGFKGALVLVVDVFLNSTSSFMKVDEDTYQVSISDYFTLRSPGSWLDVMEIRFSGNVKMLNFSTEPAWAKPPLVLEENVLKWFNLNEADAPDSYVLTLKIPGVFFSKVIRNLRAEVYRPFFSNIDSTLWLNIKNTGMEGGFFIVSLSEPCCEQARKIFLKPGEEVSVGFPIHVSEGEVIVRVFGDGDKLVEKTIQLKSFPLLSLLGFVLIIIGAFLLHIHISEQFKKQNMPTLTKEQ
ncbi:MAG: hypothetical protein QXR97_03560 [Thermoproteota archaeon]